jgi:L-lactate utilization protein LutB
MSSAQLFQQRAEAAGMHVHGGTLAALLLRLGVRSVVTTLRLELPAGVELGDDPWTADAGITDAQAAIAETGSLVLETGEGRRNVDSLVPPVHVAIVGEDSIVGSVAQWLEMLGGRALPQGITLVTGPSKTADIEGILVQGVHGPREVHVLLT